MGGAYLATILQWNIWCKNWIRMQKGAFNN